MRIARSEARILSIEASGPKSPAPLSTSSCDMPQPRLAHREVGREIGEQELDALKLDDPPARLPALVDVGDRILEGGAGNAERVGGDARPRFVERGEQQRQPGAGPADQIGARHHAILEGERRGRRGAVAHLVLGAQHREDPVFPSRQ